MSHRQDITDRDLVVLAEEIISEMVCMLADLNAPSASDSFNAKFDRFYLKGFGIANPSAHDGVLSVLDELNGGTIQ